MFLPNSSLASERQYSPPKKLEEKVKSEAKYGKEVTDQKTESRNEKRSDPYVLLQLKAFDKNAMTKMLSRWQCHLSLFNLLLLQCSTTIFIIIIMSTDVVSK